MATLFLFFLILIVVILLIRNHKKTGLAASLITLISFLAIGSGLFAKHLVNFLESPYLKEFASNLSWGKQNAIVVLGAGAIRVPVIEDVKPTVMAYSRINKAASTYFSCKKSNNKCLVIISGGDATASGKSEAEVYLNELVNLGVNKTDIITESHSMNTFKNAEYTSNILKSKSFDRVFLVTSGVHMQRSQLYFSHFGIKTIPIIADYISPFISVLPLGYNFAITDFAIHEYIGIIRLHIYNYFGWNVRSTSPGAL